MRHVYRLYGAAVQSDFALTPHDSANDATSEASHGEGSLLVTSRRVSTLPALPPPIYDVPFATQPDSVFFSVHRIDTGMVLRAGAAIDYTVSQDGTRVECLVLDGCRAEVVTQVLVEVVLPRVLQLRGAPCLHASAVARDGAALAFVGFSGSGKSTLAAALAERGYRLVCDDSLAVSVHGDGVRCHTGPPSLRLTDLSAHALFGDDAQAARGRGGKRLVACSRASESLPLRAIYAVERAPDALEIERLSPSAGFASLLQSLHRLDTESQAALAREFDLLSALVDRVPVIRLAVPHRFERLDAVCQSISSTSPRL